MGRLLRFGLLAIGACALIMFFTVGIAIFFTQPIVDAGGVFFTALQDGRVDDAYAMFSADLAEEVSQSDFRGLFDGVEVSEYVVTNREISNNIGLLGGTVLIDGENYVYELRFISSDGKWLVDAYRFNRPD